MKEIKKISNGLISRQFKLLKLGLSSGRKLVKNKTSDIKGNIQNILGSEVHKIVNELGLMKGSIMKIGQMLSLYSDSILPKEIQDILSTLESQSYYLKWDEIKKNIPIVYFNELEIEEKPLAAASLGQVHLAKNKIGELIALKIQYKGVRKAINSDIKALKYLLKFINILPANKDLTPFFEEIKDMLIQETDYQMEVSLMNEYKKKLGQNRFFYIPKSYDEFCNDKIIACEYINALSLRKINFEDISELERNQLGIEFFNLFFKEIFEMEMIQTDPNPGNYLLRKINEKWQWVLIDFGATKKINSNIKNMYKELIYSVTNRDTQAFFKLLIKYNYVTKEKKFNEELMKEYLFKVSEPFQDRIYNWGESKIPDEVLKLAPKLLKEITIDRPPKEIVFIDRKIGGVYFILKMIKSSFNPNFVLEKYKIDNKS